MQQLSFVENEIQNALLPLLNIQIGSQSIIRIIPFEKNADDIHIQLEQGKPSKFLYGNFTNTYFYITRYIRKQLVEGKDIERP